MVCLAWTEHCVVFIESVSALRACAVCVCKTRLMLCLRSDCVDAHGIYVVYIHAGGREGLRREREGKEGRGRSREGGREKMLCML